MENLKKHRHLLIFITALSGITISVIWLLGEFLFSDVLSREIIRDTTIRLAIGTLFVIICYYIDLPLFKKTPKSWIHLAIIIIPGLAISINNFPISAYLNGRVTIGEPVHPVYLYAIECLSIGFLEETVFRGIILVVLLEKMPKGRSGVLGAIIVSSAIFSLIHLLNLFAGEALPATLLQVGYSFLMGMMWAVVYMATNNLVFPILLHATYDFFGQVMFRFGTVGNRFDLVTIVITTVLAIIAGIFYLHVLNRMIGEKMIKYDSAESIKN